MSHPVKGIDHIFLMVHNLENSAEQYRRLGFTLSPRGLHSKEKGTGNYTIMFPEDYFELLGIVNETEGNHHQRRKLAEQGEGLHAIACRIDNAQEAKTALHALGLQTNNVGAFFRPVELPSGGEGIAAFETVHYADVEVPQGMVFMCQHKTRNTVWLPELIEHPNGAKGLSAIVMISATPEITAHGFARLFHEGQANLIEGLWKVTTGTDSAALLVLTPEQASKNYPGADFAKTPAEAFAVLRVRVNSVEKTKKVLAENNIVFTDTTDGIAVSPVLSSGNVLEFSEV